ncbi:PP2C family protein-serine/threonine phosphatase [Endothiovibrio diazotrophicus]
MHSHSHGRMAEFIPALEAMAEISEGFAASLEIGETLHIALARTMAQVGAEAGSLFLLDESGERLVCRASAGPVEIGGLELPLDKGIVGKSVREGRCQIIRDVRDHPDFHQAVDADTGFETRSILCSPLIVQGDCLGALELINKVGGDGLFDEEDRHFLRALAAPAALAVRNARMAATLVEQAVERERIARELELAREIQCSLLPKPPAADFPVHGLNISAREVSGDFYQYLPLADGRILFCLGDVTGKGAHAALFMARTTSLFRAFGKVLHDPGELLARLNDEVCETSTRGMFVTLAAGLYDPAIDRVRLANAGHEPPLYRDARGGYREFWASAPPVGVLPGMVYEEAEFTLDGGALYLFSDGLTEGQVAGAQLTADGVRGRIDRFAALPPAERLTAIVEPLAGESPLHDDITLLVLETPR